MNNTRQDELLMDSYKKDFNEKTGRNIKISMCGKWESLANFTDKTDFWKVVYIVFEFTGWKMKDTYTISRQVEKVFRRGLIDYIAVNNNCSIASISRKTGRDHTTVMHSINAFENRLETDRYVGKNLIEVLDYIRKYYHLHKNRIIEKEDIN